MKIRRIRAALKIAHDFARHGIEFVPVPALTDEQRERLLKEMFSRLAEIPEAKKIDTGRS